MTHTPAVALPERPSKLPFLEAISWFDSDPYALSPIDMLRRYESGWRYLDVLGTLSAEERSYLGALVLEHGSYLDVST